MQSKGHSRTTLWLLLFYGLLSIAILSPISSNTAIPNMSDFICHLAAVIQAKTALTQGQFPLRTLPSEYAGLGYPFYQFYAPTLYTLVGFIYWFLTPSNPLIAIKIAFWCGLMMGSINGGSKSDVSNALKAPLLTKSD